MTCTGGWSPGARRWATSDGGVKQPVSSSDSVAREVGGDRGLTIPHNLDCGVKSVSGVLKVTRVGCLWRCERAAGCPSSRGKQSLVNLGDCLEVSGINRCDEESVTRGPGIEDVMAIGSFDDRVACGTDAIDFDDV